MRSQFLPAIRKLIEPSRMRFSMLRLETWGKGSTSNFSAPLFGVSSHWQTTCLKKQLLEEISRLSHAEMRELEPVTSLVSQQDSAKYTPLDGRLLFRVFGLLPP